MNLLVRSCTHAVVNARLLGTHTASDLFTASMCPGFWPPIETAAAAQAKGRQILGASFGPKKAAKSLVSVTLASQGVDGPPKSSISGSARLSLAFAPRKADGARLTSATHYLVHSQLPD